MSLSYQVPDLRKRRRIPTRHSSVFGMNDEPGVCTRMKHPMTKSDAKCEKEGPMTRKLLMTVAIIAIALTPSIGIGTPVPVRCYRGFRYGRRQ